MTVYINGVLIPFVKKGLVISEKLNEELDSANIIFYSKTITESVRPFSLVQINISNEIYYFFVQSDECTRVSKYEELYQHTLVVVELTKRLSTILVDNISFTRELNQNNVTIKQAVERVISITPLSVENKHASERLLVLDSSTADLLNTKILPEMVLENKNLLEILIELYKPLDLFPLLLPQVDNKYVLSHISFNTFQEVLTESDFKVGLSKHLSMEDFFGSITMNTENTIAEMAESEIYPSRSRYFTVVSEKDMIATSNNIALKLPNPIYKLYRVWILINYRNNSTGQLFFKPVEITNWVFEKKIYDTLELDTGTFNQSNTLYYNQFEPFIYGIGNTIPNFLGFVTPALDKIIQAVPTPSGTSKTSLGVLDNSYTTQQILTGKFGFRVEFLPVLSNKIRIFKDPIEFSDSHEHSLYGNQSTNTPNIQNLISNIKSNLNRMANNSMSQEIVIGNYSDRFKVGQKYGDFIVSEATHKIYDDNYMKSTATFSKYWNRLSSQIGINQEERQYKILLNEKTLRKLVYNDFLVFDTSIPSTNPTDISNIGLTSTGRSYIWQQFFSSSYNSEFNKTIEGAFVRTYDANDNLIGKFLVDITKQNSVSSFNSFYFDFETNVAAIRHLTRLKDSGLGSDTLLKALFGDYVNIMKSNKYSLDGLVEKMSVQYFNILTPEALGGSLLGWLESIVPDKGSIGGGEGTATKRYFKELVGGQYLWYVGVLSGGTWTYTLTDRESVLNYYYLGYSTSFTNQYLEDSSQYGPPNARNHLKWYSDADIAAGNAPYPKNVIANLNKMIVKKDNGEKLSFNYQLNYITKSDKIILGQFATYNRIISYRNDWQLYFHLSTTETYNFGDVKPKGVRNNVPFSFSATIVNSGTSNDYLKISMNYNLANYQLAGGTLPNPTQQQIDEYLMANVKSWAITGSSVNDLYFGVNPKGTKVDVYIYVKHSV